MHAFSLSADISLAPLIQLLIAQQATATLEDNPYPLMGEVRGTWLDTSLGNYP